MWDDHKGVGWGNEVGTLLLGSSERVRPWVMMGALYSGMLGDRSCIPARNQSSQPFNYRVMIVRMTYAI